MIGTYNYLLVAVINIVSSVWRSVDLHPLIIGHRGSSGMYPEHTALAYRYVFENQEGRKPRVGGGETQSMFNGIH